MRGRQIQRGFVPQINEKSQLRYSQRKNFPDPRIPEISHLPQMNTESDPGVLKVRDVTFLIRTC